MSLPWFKAAGGKRALAPLVLQHLQLEKAKRYVEPFLGGGAVFLAARAAGFAGPCLLNDANATLLYAWRAVLENPARVIEAFQSYASQDSRPFYYSVRQLPPDNLFDRAGWFLYLNKAGFNGLWRVNRKGDNNVPYGDGKPCRINAEVVYAASEALRGCSVLPFDFGHLIAQRGDAIYCDPPYLPVSKTANFTGYTAGGFSASDQLRLAKWCVQAAEKGARVVLSNSGTVDSQAAFAGADEAIPVTERRAINRDGAKRGPVGAFLYIWGPRG